MPTALFLPSMLSCGAYSSRVCLPRKGPTNTSFLSTYMFPQDFKASITSGGA